MKPIATFDIETDPFKRGRFPQPFACDFFDGKTHRTFTGKRCVRDCFKLMRKFDGYIYAHNGGKFDFQYLLPLLPIPETKLHTIKSRIAKIILPGGKCEFRDSFCMMPIALKTYNKVEIDYTKLEPDVRHLHMPEIISYLKSDCENLYRMVNEFIDEYGFGLTIAGRAFSELKKRFDITPPKTNKFYDARFRRFYYGGRVEFFELGNIKGTFEVYDINSAYPFAMKQEHVFGTEFISLPCLPTNAKILRTCFIRFIGACKGGLPWKADDGSLSFKAHDGEFFVTGWELEAAQRLKLVTISRVVECHRPLTLKNFSPFVDYFYGKKARAEKGSGEEIAAKLMLNSCYGRYALNAENFTDTQLCKFGEEPDENNTARREGKEPLWTLGMEFEEICISVWEKSVPLNAKSFYNVATAASITGCVRAHLLESLAEVRRPVYCDTDCIICESPGPLPIGSEIGEWKLEGKTVEDGMHIAGKKLYAANLTSGKWKCASKGVRITPADIVKIASGESVTSTLEAPTFSLKSGARFVTRTVRRDDKRIRRVKRKVKQ